MGLPACGLWRVKGVGFVITDFIRPLCVPLSVFFFFECLSEMFLLLPLICHRKGDIPDIPEGDDLGSILKRNGFANEQWLPDARAVSKSDKYRVKFEGVVLDRDDVGHDTA